MQPEEYEILDALHAEMMAAYTAAAESLEAAWESGLPADVERHREQLRRAWRLSTSYHLEADLLMLTYYARREALHGA